MSNLFCFVFELPGRTHLTDRFHEKEEGREQRCLLTFHPLQNGPSGIQRRIPIYLSRLLELKCKYVPKVVVVVLLVFVIFFFCNLMSSILQRSHRTPPWTSLFPAGFFCVRFNAKKSCMFEILRFGFLCRIVLVQSEDAPFN